MPPVSILDTFQDLVEHLSDYSGGEVMDRGLRDYKRAAIRGYQDLALSNEWKSYLTRGRVILNPLQDTGTIAFDLTGGAYERLVTLTDFTWPLWAEFGTLLIDGVRYKVDERKSNTQITLMHDSCPTADVATGTAYTLYQNIYPLPEDFRRLNDLHYENGLGCLQALPGVAEWLGLDQMSPQSGRPVAYAIGGSPDTWQYGKLSLYVHPYPDEGESIDFIYWRNPRPLFYTGQETAANVGTVSVTINTAAVVGVSTAFSQKMVGSLIRFSTNSSLPEGAAGMNPYQEQRVIISVTDATHLTLNEAVDFAYAAVKYAITDPIDADAALLEALYRNAELQLDNFRHPERVASRERAYQKAWVQACERDQRVMPAYGLYGVLWQFGGGTLIVSQVVDDEDPAPGGETAVPPLLFSQTSIETVDTSDADEPLSGTGEGSLTIGGGEWTIADAIRVRASGTYGTKATIAGNLTLKLKWGSSITQTFVLPVPDAQSGKQWSLDATLTRHSVGPTGTVSGPGEVVYAIEGETDTASETDNVANETLSADASQTIALTAEWATADAANTITCSQLTVEQQGTS